MGHVFPVFPASLQGARLRSSTPPACSLKAVEFMAGSSRRWEAGVPQVPKQAPSYFIFLCLYLRTYTLRQKKGDVGRCAQHVSAAIRRKRQPWPRASQWLIQRRQPTQFYSSDGQYVQNDYWLKRNRLYFKTKL